MNVKARKRNADRRLLKWEIGRGEDGEGATEGRTEMRGNGRARTLYETSDAVALGNWVTKSADIYPESEGWRSRTNPMSCDMCKIQALLIIDRL